MIKQILQLLRGFSRQAEQPASEVKTHALAMWFTTEGYKICVHEMKDEVVLDTGIQPATYVRSIRINVEYRNESNETLRYGSTQWLLYDGQGYQYEFEIRTQFFSNDAPRRLQSGRLSPGQRARGWVAFQAPKDAELHYVQFRADYLTEHVTDISVVPVPPTP